MDSIEMLSSYLSQHPDRDKRDDNRLTKVIEILRNAKIIIPVTTNLTAVCKSVLIPEIMKLPRVKTEKTAEGYITAFNKLNKWLIGQQIGDKTMLLPLEYKERTEVVTGNEQAEVQETEATLNLTASESEKESVKPEANTEVEVSSEPNQHGKAMKGEKEKTKRKQISVYLNVETYEQLQDISYFTGLEIAKLSERAILKLIESNHEQLEKAQELKSRISTMGFEI